MGQQKSKIPIAVEVKKSSNDELDFPGINESISQKINEILLQKDKQLIYDIPQNVNYFIQPNCDFFVRKSWEALPIHIKLEFYNKHNFKHVITLKSYEKKNSIELRTIGRYPTTNFSYD